MDYAIDPPLDRALTPADVGRGLPEHPRLVVEIWLVFPDRQHLLMLKRSPARQGFWQGVSGCTELTDATLRATALRELHEETGMLPASEDLFDLKRGYAYRGAGSGKAFRKRCLGLWLPEGFDPDSIALSEEHTELRVVPLADVQDLLQFDEMREELEALKSYLKA